MVVLTKHAYDRIREREGINKKAAERICDKAYQSGISSADVNGSLQRYMSDGDRSKNLDGFKARIYGDFVYCFLEQGKNVVVLTAFWVPKNLRNQSLAAQRRKSK